MNSAYLHKFIRFILNPVLLYALLPTAFAQTPQSIPVGPFDFQASLLVEYVEDDNLYQSSSSQVSTGITTIAPTFELIFDNGISGVSLSYSVENATFTDVPEENYTDQRFDVSAGTAISGLHRVELTGSYVESHDRQSVDALSSNDELDEFEDLSYEASYTLGIDESVFNFSLSTGEFERTYVNNRTVTRLSDREERFYRAGLFWNISPSLTAGINYTDTEIQYVIAQDTRDGDEKVTAFDLRWDALDTLTFDVSLGQTERTTNSNQSNESDYWDVEIEWAVLSYSTLSLYSASYVDEAEATGVGFSVREETGFGWSHEWTDRIETELSYIDTTISYETSGIPREDNSEEINLRASYQFRRWINVSVFIQNITRSSSAGDNEEYDQQIYGISGLFTL